MFTLILFSILVSWFFENFVSKYLVFGEKFEKVVECSYTRKNCIFWSLPSSSFFVFTGSFTGFCFRELCTHVVSLLHSSHIASLAACHVIRSGSVRGWCIPHCPSYRGIVCFEQRVHRADISCALFALGQFALVYSRSGQTMRFLYGLHVCAPIRIHPHVRPSSSHRERRDKDVRKIDSVKPMPYGCNHSNSNDSFSWFIHCASYYEMISSQKICRY